MTTFKILLSKSAVSQLNSLDTSTSTRIKTGLKGIEIDPFHHRSGADIKRLVIANEPPLYRLRVGDYRVIYFVMEERIKVTEIIHRSKGYKWLE